MLAATELKFSWLRVREKWGKPGIKDVPHLDHYASAAYNSKWKKNFFEGLFLKNLEYLENFITNNITQRGQN